MQVLKYKGYGEALGMSEPFTLQEAGKYVEVGYAVFLAYTGCNDTEGTEIYVGDIVEVSRRSYTTGIMITFREVVVWDEKACAYRLNGESESLTFYTTMKKVGDTYTTPQTIKFDK